MKKSNLDIKATGRGTLQQQLRLWSGLVLLVYVTGHFINHMLGLFSLQAMEEMLLVMSMIWDSIPGNIVLYGALFIHILLAALSVLSIRSLKMPFWRWLQIGLGFAIPYWLASHIIVTRGSEILTGVDVTYSQELALLWPVSAIKQNALLLIVWFHGMLGLHFWLRPKQWYRDGVVLLVPLVVAVPMLAIVGWIVAAQRQLSQITKDPSGEAAQTLSANIARVKGAVVDYQATAQIGVLIVFATLVVLYGLIFLARKLRKKVTVSYGNHLSVETTPGTSILDVSRNAGLPHMSVCGGRARCSTCRILVMDDQAGLSPVGPAERKLLDKINAEPNMRLACQARVWGNVEVRPIIQPKRVASTPLKSDPFGWGVEREVTILHLKINEFLSLVEKSLPYDAVFILNHFLDLVVEQIESEGGYIDKFTNDGVIAIFGLETTSEKAARSALMAAAKCHQLTLEQDAVLTQHLERPLKIGIGIHTSKSIIGRIGKTSDQTAPSRVTAIGKASGVAAALEVVTQKIEASIVYSRYTHNLCALGLPEMLGKVTRIQVPGIEEPVEAIVIKNSGPIKKKLQA